MMPLRIVLSGAVLVSGLLFASGIGAEDRACDLAQLARQVYGDKGINPDAVRALRRAGQPGMDALMHAHAALIERGPQPSVGEYNSKNPDVVWERLTAALDEVGAARDSYSAGLYWYTDLEEAKAAAKKSGKPILSLRLLGNLDQEYSCANSRYFRTALYANKELSAYLRQNYVLHWKSERRVPTITIEFGDGRKIERTITGNSAHYVLDSDGNVIDALPGLYGPGAFLASLQQAAAVVKRGSTPQARARFAAAKVRAIEQAWTRDLAALGVALPTGAERAALDKAGDDAGAPEIDLRTTSKSQVERPILRQIFPADQFKAVTNNAGWERLAALHHRDAQLDSGSLRLMYDKSPLLRASAPEPSGSPMAVAFAQSLALDTVRNECLMHRIACEWIAAGRGTVDLEALNARIYTELFATPDSDPWLGLLPTNVYTGLDNDGLSNTPPCRAVTSAR
jgi:hypothetical protein